MSADFVAGYISGAAGIIIGNPLDLIKVRLQAGTTSLSSGYTGQFTGAGSLVRGATAPILGYGALNALLFITYNRTRLLLDSRTSSPPSLWATWLAGAVGGLATWAVSTPTELVKCRAQASSWSPTLRISSLGIARQILRTEGIRGLYLGGVVTALRDSIGYGFYFWSYELSTRTLASKRSNSTGTSGAGAAQILLCGGFAGVMTWATIFPLDVIKTRVQTQLLQVSESGTPPLGGSLLNPGMNSTSAPAPRAGALQIACRTYRNEGVAAFFKGLTVCSVRAFMVNAVQWAVYEWVMKTVEPSSKAAM